MTIKQGYKIDLVRCINNSGMNNLITLLISTIISYYSNQSNKLEEYLFGLLKHTFGIYYVHIRLRQLSLYSILSKFITIILYMYLLTLPSQGNSN